MGFSVNGLGLKEFSELGETNESLKHEFTDPVSLMCHADTMVAPWSLTQEVAGSNLSMANILSEFCETLRGNSNVFETVLSRHVLNRRLFTLNIIACTTSLFGFGSFTRFNRA